MKLFEWYQYAAPALGLPLLYWVWQAILGPKRAAAFLVVLVLQAYIVPGLGTNWTRLYEFRSRWRWGRFRPHQGLVFGTAAAALAVLGRSLSPWAVGALCAGLVWSYDSVAITRGFIVVYNQPWALGRPAWRIAADYALPYFFTYGAVLAAWSKALERDPAAGIGFYLAGLACLCALPVAGLTLASWIQYGHSGLWPQPRSQP
jgi:hypothetical protein